MTAQQIGRGRGLCNPYKKYRKLVVLFPVSSEIYEHHEIWQPRFEQRCRDEFDKAMKSSSFAAEDYMQVEDRSSIFEIPGNTVILRAWRLKPGAKRKGKAI